MITKEMIKKGFEANIISIENKFADCISLCCRIGGNAFYFIGMEDEDLTVEEYWKSYTMDMTINMLYQILKNVRAAEDSGLGEGEYEYYQLLLNLVNERNNKND